ASCRVAETNVRPGCRQRGKVTRAADFSLAKYSALLLRPFQPANNIRMPITRRSFVAAVGGSLTVFSRSLCSRAQEPYVEFAFRQYHNQTSASSLHKRLVEMWDAVFKES